MNIHLPAILMFTRGTRFWHTAKWIRGCFAHDQLPKPSHAIPCNPTPIRAFGSGSLGRNLSWETLPNLGRWDPFIAKLLFHVCGHWSLRFHTHCSILPTQKLPFPSKHETWKHANTCKLTPKNYMTKWPNHPNPISVFPNGLRVLRVFSSGCSLFGAAKWLSGWSLPCRNAHNQHASSRHSSDIFRHIHPTSKIQYPLVI